MSRPPVDVHLVLIEAMEKWLKVVVYLWLVNLAYDFICALPPEMGTKVVDWLMKKYLPK